MKRLIIFSLILILLATTVTAVKIEGEVYDLDFNTIDKGTVTINTNPSQTQVLKDGKYIFDIEQGVYQLTAHQYSIGEIVGSSSKNITITRDGIFIVDLIIYPVTQSHDIEELDNIFKTEEELIYSPSASLFRLVNILIVLAIAIFIYYLIRFRAELTSFEKKEKITFDQSKTVEDVILENDLEIQILNFIKSEHTTSQKEIRKKFPQYSEAKISLVISKLTSLNKIKKYKKGRSNIISID